jgi:hypothetical protein
VALAIACLLVAGCDLGDVGDVGCVTGMAVETVCAVETSGTATDSSGSAMLSSVASPDDGCDGSCTDNFTFFVQSASANCIFFASARPGGSPLTPQTVTLPSDVVSVVCTSTTASSPSVPVVSGTLTIESIDMVSLHATFALQLSQPGGSPLDISNGKVSISDCHDAEVCTF